MMMNASRRKHTEMEERRVLRVERESAAGKLLRRVPDLTSLNLVIHEVRPDGCTNDTHYIRRIVVDHAPALFEVPCSYADCQDGGYDVTREVLMALSAHQLTFQGEHACRGRSRAGDCGRILRYVGTATYAVKPSTTAQQ